MGKKSKQKDVIVTSPKQEENKRMAIASNFFPNNAPVTLSFSSEQDPLAYFCELAKNPPAPDVPTQDQLRERCMLIRTNIMVGESDNIEVQLNKGCQIYSGFCSPASFLLGNTIVKIRPMGTR